LKALTPQICEKNVFTPRGRPLSVRFHPVISRQLGIFGSRKLSISFSLYYYIMKFLFCFVFLISFWRS